jgi:cytochrome c oxidase cbb3-type subunit 3
MSNPTGMKSIITFLILMTTVPLIGQAASTSHGLNFHPDIDFILLAFAVFLLLPLSILAKAFIMSAQQQLRGKGKPKLMITLPIVMLISSGAIAQSKQAVASIYQASNYITVALLALIAIEFLLILFFASRILHLVKPDSLAALTMPWPSRVWKWFADKWQTSTFVPVEKEADIDLNHDYDGIRELDNVIPPWFTAAFVLCIIFAGVYMYRYHIAKSAPMQIEELEIAIYKAELEHEAYLSKQLNSIDETNVSVMTGADIEAGQKTFVAMCAVCHKPDGGGMVGPNLTDEYWIHGGSLKDIFKVIKYGVPDKGMISWKEQVSPLQMAQLSNYIRTLKGTNPPDAKAKQGDLYLEAESAAIDTLVQHASADSIVIKQ